MSRPWMPLYIADYLKDTAHLRAAESGAYLHLIMHHWVHGELPDDNRQLAFIAKMTDSEWKRARPLLAKFFSPGWRHERVIKELAAAAAAYEKRANAGQKGGKARSIAISIATANDQAKDQALANHTHSHSATQKETAASAPAPDPSVSSLQALTIRLFEAGGLALDRKTAGLEIMAVPMSWIEGGADLDLDILPTIARVCSRSPPNSRRSWSYFTQAVADALAQRTKPLPEGNSYAGPQARSGNRLTDAFGQIVDTLAARSGDRGGDRGDRPVAPGMRVVAAE